MARFTEDGVVLDLGFRIKSKDLAGGEKQIKNALTKGFQRFDTSGIRKSVQKEVKFIDQMFKNLKPKKDIFKPAIDGIKETEKRIEEVKKKLAEGVVSEDDILNGITPTGLMNELEKLKKVWAEQSAELDSLRQDINNFYDPMIESAKKAQEEAKKLGEEAKILEGIDLNSIAQETVNHPDFKVNDQKKYVKDFKGALIELGVSYERATELASEFRVALRNAVIEMQRAKIEAMSMTNAFETGSKRTFSFGSIIKKTFGGIGKIIGGAFGGVKKIISGTFGIIGKVLGGGFRGLTKVFGGFGKLIKGVFKRTKEGAEKSGASLKRLIGLGATLGTIFLLVRTAINYAKEGFSNLSKASGETKDNVRNFQASLQYLKNALGTCIAPIYNTIAPALSKFIDMLASGANAFAKFIAVLTGKQIVVAKKTFTGIGDSVGNVGSALGGASENAEELKRQLMGFDQIEKLDDVTSNLGSSGGGSGGGSGINYDDMFTTAEADGATSKWAELIKKSWEEADFTEVGGIIGTKLGDALEKIPWGSIQEKAKKVGTSLGTLITGFVETPGLSNKIGTTLAQGVNTVLAGLNGFMSSTNFSSIGSFISSGIVSALDGINWSEVGKLIVSFPTAVFNFIAGLIQGIKWGELPGKIAGWIKDALTGAKWDQLFASAGNLAGSILGAIWDLGGALADIMGNVAGEIKDYFVQKINAAGYDKDKSLLENGKAIITGVFNGIIDFFKTIGTWVKNNIITPFITGVENALGLENGTLIETGKSIITGIFNGIIDWFKGIGTWLKENIFDPFIGGIKSLFGINSPSTEMESIGTNIMDGLFGGISDKVDGVLGIFSGIKESIGAFFKDPIGTVKVAVDKGVETAKELWDGFTNSEVVKTLKEKGKDVVEGAKKVWDGIQNSEVVKDLKQKGKDVIEGAKSVWEGIKSGEALKTLKEKGKTAIEGAKKIWDGIKNNTVTKTLSNAFSKNWSKNRTYYDGDKAPKKGTITKTFANAFAKKWSDNRKYFDGKDSPKSSTLTKTLANTWADWTKWKERRNEYNGISNKDAIKTLKSKWGDGRKWDRAIAEYNAVKDKTVTVTLKSQDKIAAGGGWYYMSKATGGAFYGGSWHNIPQYASGGRPEHGSLFVAGEAGPELVGAINGRTEVLNRTQLGSVIASGVRKTFNSLMSTLNFNIPDPTPALHYVGQVQQQAVQQQAQTNVGLMNMLAQIIVAIKEIDTDTYWDADKVTNDIIKRINRRTRATGVSPILY